MMPASVIHPESVTVLKHALVRASISFPLGVRAEHDFATYRSMQLELHSVESINEMLINKEFSTGSNVNRLGGSSHSGVIGTQQQDHCQAEYCDCGLKSLVSHDEFSNQNAE